MKVFYITRNGGSKPGTALLLLGVLAAMASFSVFAGDDDHRWEYYGVIKSIPDDGFHGEWTIGERVFTTDSGTEFDQEEGILEVGKCAKVEVRNGRVHEIDSEPMRDCL